MHKFLYLTKKEWVDVWVNGGEIPISLASSYLSKNRDGTLTPDENLIHESPVDLKSLSPGIHIGGNVKDITITNSFINGKRVPDIISGNYFTEDGLIFSFCNVFDKDIAHRLNKEACVRLNNLEKLRRKIDKQLGSKGVMKECEYTNDHQRNHFLKSTKDSWQQEFRIFWKYPKNKIVTIPSGHGELVEIFE